MSPGKFKVVSWVYQKRLPHMVLFIIALPHLEGCKNTKIRFSLKYPLRTTDQSASIPRLAIFYIVAQMELCLYMAIKAWSARLSRVGLTPTFNSSAKLTASLNASGGVKLELWFAISCVIFGTVQIGVIDNCGHCRWRQAD